MVHVLRKEFSAAAVLIAVNYTPHTVQALEGNQCKAAWNVAALNMRPVKDMLSAKFRDSMKAAFFVMKDGVPLQLKNGEFIMRPCDVSEKRELVFQTIEDATAYEIIEADTKGIGIPFDTAFILKRADNATDELSKWLLLRAKARLQHNVP